MKVVLNPLPEKYERVEAELPETCPECGGKVTEDAIEGVYYVWMPYTGKLSADGNFKPEEPTFERVPDGDTLGPFPAAYRCFSCGEDLLYKK